VIAGALRPRIETTRSALPTKRRSREIVDPLFQDDLAGNRLGDFDDGCEVEVFDGRVDRGSRMRRRRFLPQLRKRAFKLPDLAQGSPPHVGVASGAQMRLSARDTISVGSRASRSNPALRRPDAAGRHTRRCLAQLHERARALGVRELLRKPLQRKDIAECFGRVLPS
jgi:hypothetical protein